MPVASIDPPPGPCYNRLGAVRILDLAGASVSEIVVIGSLNMDLVVRAPRLPSPGETVRGEAFRTIPGGKGANQAAAIALLGQPVTMLGRVGDDAFGEQLAQNLGAKGVDPAHLLATVGVATGTATIIVDAAGQNSIVIAPGANGQVTPQDVDDCDGLLRQARYLVLQLEIPLETVAHAIDKAARHGVQVVLNPAPAAQLPARLLSRVRYLVPNESEAQWLTGLPVSDAGSAARAADRLRQQGAHTVIITLGSQGAYVASPDGSFHMPVPEVTVVDTTAAGDAFIGGLVVALSRGLSLRDAVRYASCAGALAVTRFGAQTSLPSGAEVERLFQAFRPA
ncbi:MAG: ribokinase [Chloroflexi bacterium]|nr:ribokinase [Chloroflexota bacterium]